MPSVCPVSQRSLQGPASALFTESDVFDATFVAMLGALFAGGFRMSNPAESLQLGGSVWVWLSVMEFGAERRSRGLKLRSSGFRAAQ